MAQIQLQKIGPTILTPATPEASEFLQRIKLGEWIRADFKRVRNYAFHKRFFKLLQLGFDYWTPVGGALRPEEKILVSRFVDHLISLSGRDHAPALHSAADEYLLLIGSQRSRDITLIKSFEPFRAWVTVGAGFYDEFIFPDGTISRVPKSISFANMDEDQFQQLYKSVLNVLWLYILFRSFKSEEEAGNVAAQLMEFA